MARGGMVRFTGAKREGKVRAARAADARHRALVATGVIGSDVRELPSGEYAISKAQRNVHVTFEALAVFVSVPFLGYLALSKKDKPLEDWERFGLGAMAITTLAVDGALLVQWMRQRKKAKENNRR